MYASRVGDRRLNFAVSGKLWQRSLVMSDEETGTLWSHLLGRAMEGPLEGTTLESLPSVITDWATWKGRHPETTVLQMSLTSNEYNVDVYEEFGLEAFVVGMSSGGYARAWPLEELASRVVVQDAFQEQPLLLYFDETSMSPFAYDRQIGDRVLTFQKTDAGWMDEQTESVWSLRDGRAVSGELEGEQLKPAIVILSFKRPWDIFHPESSYWSP